MPLAPDEFTATVRRTIHRGWTSVGSQVLRAARNHSIGGDTVGSDEGGGIRL
jgi:hypothetical protein